MESQVYLKENNHTKRKSIKIRADQLKKVFAMEHLFGRFAFTLILKVLNGNEFVV